MGIADWPEDERPRERLLKLGAAALSEAELLAIFLRTGVAGKSAVELGRDLPGRFGSLDRLFAAPWTMSRRSVAWGRPSTSSFRRWSRWLVARWPSRCRIGTQ